MIMDSRECERRSKPSSTGESATSSSSAAAAPAVGHAIDVKDSMPDTKLDTDEGITSDSCNLKEDGCSTADTETDIDLTGSNAKRAMQMQNDDDESSIQSQSQIQETTFPQQLMDLIESETTDDNAVTVHGQKAIEWLSKGDKFIIRDKVALESRVLPNYFNNKCKFMSFVRKLYRWGFRQVEKDFSSGKMIFKHKHFTRGDKKKCLAMRSIVNVKKPPASSVVAMNVSSNRRQGYRDHGLPNPNPYAGDVVSNHHLQSNRHIHGGDNSTLSNLGHGGTHNMLGRRVNPGLPMNYGLSMQMQLPHSNYLHNGLNWTVPVPVPGLVHNRSEVTQRPSITASMVAALHANQGHSTANTVSQPSAGLRNYIGRSAEEVNLAALIMNEDPTIDAWGALQLAKRHLNGTPATSDLRRPN